MSQVQFTDYTWKASISSYTLFIMAITGEKCYSLHFYNQNFEIRFQEKT